MTEFQIPLESLTSIKDKVVLITGSSSGIGKATVALCLSLGARVIAGDINPPPDEFLQQHGGAEKVSSSLLFEKTDAADWSSIRNLFIKGVERFGGIDHVFANAGIGPRSNFLEETFEDGAGPAGELLAPPNLKVLDVNLIGVIYTVRLGVYYLRHSGKDVNRVGGAGGGQRSPGITVTASASSFQDFGAADYTVAKHGVLGILRGLYTDLMHVDSSESERTTVRLNAISPSWTATGVVPRDVLMSMGVEVQDPEVVARSVVMLFTDSARHGEVIYSWEGRYCEINRCEGGLLNGVSRILPNVMGEGPVMERLKGR